MLDELPEFDEVDVEVESLLPLPVLVEVDEVEGAADVPGMVAALIAAKTPTPATAATDAPTVMLWSRRRALSRERALA